MTRHPLPVARRFSVSARRRPIFHARIRTSTAARPRGSGAGTHPPGWAHPSRPLPIPCPPNTLLGAPTQGHPSVRRRRGQALREGGGQDGRRWRGERRLLSWRGIKASRVVCAATPHVPVRLEADAGTIAGTVHRAGPPARQRSCRGAQAQRGRPPPDHGGRTAARVHPRQVPAGGGSQPGENPLPRPHAHPRTRRRRPALPARLTAAQPGFAAGRRWDDTGWVGARPIPTGHPQLGAQVGSVP